MFLNGRTERRGVIAGILRAARKRMRVERVESDPRTVLIHRGIRATENSGIVTASVR